MKFGQKIFLVSFTLIIIAINGIGIIMINNTYKANIEKEIDKNMIQINSIMTEVEMGISSFANIANMYWQNNVNIQLYSQGKMVYTNFEQEYPEIEEKLITDEDKTTWKELEEIGEINIDNRTNIRCRTTSKKRRKRY